MRSQPVKPTTTAACTGLKRRALLGAIALLAAINGCGPILQTPVRVAVTSFDLSPLPPFLPKRVLFQRDLENYLKEPVVFDLMTPRQIRVHLQSGRAKFAMMSPADYGEIAPAQSCELLAMAQNGRGKTYRRGLLIVSPHSRVQEVSQIKKQRFHFLPAGDVLNEAALGSLSEVGISRKDIDQGILGLELDTSHISSLEVAKSVVLENAVGVIDEADYESWPDRGGSLVLLTPSKEQVRVIGKTVRVPELMFVASKEASADLRDKVKHYLLEDVKDKKLVLGVLGVNGFAEPTDVAQYEPYFELHRKLRAAGKQTAPAPQPTIKPAI